MAPNGFTSVIVSLGPDYSPCSPRTPIRYPINRYYNFSCERRDEHTVILGAVICRPGKDDEFFGLSAKAYRSIFRAENAKSDAARAFFDKGARRLGEPGEISGLKRPRPSRLLRGSCAAEIILILTGKYP